MNTYSSNPLLHLSQVAMDLANSGLPYEPACSVFVRFTTAVLEKSLSRQEPPGFLDILTRLYAEVQAANTLEAAGIFIDPEQEDYVVVDTQPHNDSNFWRLTIANADLRDLSLVANADPNAEENLGVENNVEHTPLGGPEAQELAAKYVRSNDVYSLGLLLGNIHPRGRSPTRETFVHQRPNNNGATLVEVACEEGVHFNTFEKVMDFADPERLNDVNNESMGPIHLLIPWSEGRDRKLKLLLDKGASPDLLWVNSSALVCYIFEKQHEAALILLDEKADPSQTTVRGMDAAQAAAAMGYVEILRKIQAETKGFNWDRTFETTFTTIHRTGPESMTVLDCTAVHVAAWTGAGNILRFYSNNFQTDLNHATVDGIRPIHLAAASGSATCVKILHELEADLTARTQDGSTALHLAVRNGHAPVVKELLKEVPGLSAMSNQAGRTPFMNALRDRPDLISIFTDCQLFTSKPNNALLGEMVHGLIRLGDPELFNRLLETSGVDFESCPLPCGCTPVMLALHEKNSAVLQLLAEGGFNGFRGVCSTHHVDGVDVIYAVSRDPELSEALYPLLSSYLRGNDWTIAPASPIHAAAESGHHEAINTILQHIRDKEDEYRRQFCFGRGNPAAIPQPEMIRLVLNQATMRGASDFVPGSTPLHISATKGHIDVTKLLLENGADVHAQDEENDSPLHNAIKSGHGHILKVLLSNGANASRAHGQGLAPVLVAAEKDLSMTIDLVNAGASLEKSMEGMSALSYAAENGTPEICDFLIERGLDPYARDKSSYMPVDDMTLRHDMLDYALRFDLERLQELPKGRLSLIIELNREKSVSMLKTLLQRLPDRMVKEMVNVYPQRFVSPLCAAVYRDIFGAIDVLVEYGADVNLEGSNEGTPLMVACSRGRLESVKLLVGRGALLAYRNQTGTVRNAMDMARKFPEIQGWLLVGQFTERRRLGGISDADLRQERPWSGVWTATCVLWDFAELPRGGDESQAQFDTRKNQLRDKLRGTVVKVQSLDVPR